MVAALGKFHDLLISYSRAASMYATMERARHYDTLAQDEIARETRTGTNILRTSEAALITVRQNNPKILRELGKRTVQGSLAELANSHNNTELNAEWLGQKIRGLFLLINCGHVKQNEQIYSTITRTASNLKIAASYMVE